MQPDGRELNRSRAQGGSHINENHDVKIASQVFRSWRLFVFEMLFGNGEGKEGLLKSQQSDTVLLSGLEAMKPEVQSQLSAWLRAQESAAPESGPRLVLSISEELKGLLQQKLIEESLYYALSVVELKVPPLRSRRVLFQKHFQSLAPAVDCVGSELARLVEVVLSARFSYCDRRRRLA